MDITKHLVIAKGKTKFIILDQRKTFQKPKVECIYLR